MNFFSDVFWASMTRIIVVITGIIVSIITAHSLGPEGRGIYALTFFLTNGVVQFGNLGIYAANTHFGARNKELIPGLVSNSFFISSVFGIISILFLFLLFYLYPSLFPQLDSKILFIGLISVPFLLLTLLLQYIFISKQSFVLYNAITLCSNILLAISLTITLIMFKQGVFEAVFVITVVNILSAFFTVWLLNKDGEFKKMNLPDFKLFKKTFRYGIKCYIASLFLFFLLQSNIYFINLYRNASDVGIYSIAITAAVFCTTLPVSIGFVLWPKISKSGIEGGELTAKVSRYLIGIMLIICVAAFLLADPILLFVFGKSFSLSADIFKLLLPTTFFYSFIAIYNNHFAGRGYPSVVVYSSLLGFLILIFLNIIFVPLYGTIAAAINLNISCFIIFCMLLISLRASENLSYKKLLVPSFEDLNFIIITFSRKNFRKKI